MVVQVGTVIIVQPGEKVPIDGVVVEGHSSLNTSALTGESVPREVAVGEEIVSGCINLSGLLKIRTTREFGESTVSKILDLVENASSKKSRSENFISRFAHYYTPAVCYGALALAFLPPIVRMLFMGLPAEWGTWIYRALTFLVISCPCALVISIPLSFFAGIGCASANGVLVKGSNYLEALSDTQYVVFDKTGTLTKGVFEVTGIYPANNFDKDTLIRLAAFAESASSHPISVSLKKNYGKEINIDEVSDIQEIAGHGVSALVDGKRVFAGNIKLMKKENIAVECEHDEGTVVYVSCDGEYAGCIVISDVVKENSKKAISSQKLDVSKAGTYTVSSWMKTWYEVYAEPHIRPNTKSYYTNYIENHIIPGIGSVPLDKLTTIQIQRFYNNLQKSGRVQRKNFPELRDKSLSPRVVRGVHTLLHNCLEQAVAERLILTNPTQGCKLPQLEKKEMKILPQEKIGMYLAEAERRGLLAAFYLELTTGLRRGELLALQWTDLDIENRTLAVTKQVNRINGELVVSPPKTRNSIRTLALPQQAVDLLIAEHQKHPHNPYLFPSPKTGTMYDPDAFRRTHDKILKAIGAEHIRFHDLRHTFATLSLKSGVDVKTLSGALGHYSAGFTLNTYTHATAQMKQDAADTIGGVISQQMR